jgi:6-phosphogluconolactonase
MPADAPVPRVTLTRGAILAARTVLIALSGEDKKAVLERALEEGDGALAPVGRVLAGTSQAIDIHWCP